MLSVCISDGFAWSWGLSVCKSGWFAWSCGLSVCIYGGFEWFWGLSGCISWGFGWSWGLAIKFWVCRLIWSWIRLVIVTVASVIGLLLLKSVLILKSTSRPGGVSATNVVVLIDSLRSGVSGILILVWFSSRFSLSNNDTICLNLLPVLPKINAGYIICKFKFIFI